MQSVCTISDPSNSPQGEHVGWSRPEVVTALHKLEAEELIGGSLRGFAASMGIPRSTLRHWLERRDNIDASPAVLAFFESPDGLAFLHRLVVASQFVITHLGAGGYRLVSEFLTLSGLDRFVAASHGSQHKAVSAVEQAIVGFGENERSRLGKSMEPRAVTVCQDETFHPQICLVAMEPVSNFILLERYASKRDAKTWDEAMDEALDGLSVEVVQSTGDEGKGLLRHVQQSLGVHHSPDLFHVQQDIGKATSAPLRAQVRQAETACEQAHKELVQVKHKHRAYEENIASRGPGRPPDWERREGDAEQALEAAEAELELRTTRKEEVREAVRGMSAAYHPFELETGEQRSAEQVDKELDSCLEWVELSARAAALKKNSIKKLAKARRVLPKMVATIAFVHEVIALRVAALCLDRALEQVVIERWIPGLYIAACAERAATAEQRARLRKNASALLEPLRSPDGPLAAIPLEQRISVEAVVLECAQLFQRSSSCVEGRNGQLALKHHSLHRLSKRKLDALTTVHNFFIRRPD
ncbi:MAG: hypothetical protein GY722_28750, partial [bacterium]|nr:hypothetical protein [bacterium]